MIIWKSEGLDVGLVAELFIQNSLDGEGEKQTRGYETKLVNFVNIL